MRYSCRRAYLRTMIIKNRRFLRRIRPIAISIAVFLCFLVYISHGYDHLLAKSILNFNWPLTIDGDLDTYIARMLNNSLTVTKVAHENNIEFVNLGKDCRTHSSKKIAIVTILLAVKTAPANFEAREAIRNTWGQVMKFKPFDITGQAKLRVSIERRFFVGKVLVDGLQRELEAEQSIYHDIVQGEYLDTYYNLTFKIKSAFKYATEHCTSADFVLLIDDDSYLSMDKIIPIVLDAVANKEAVYFGYAFQAVRPLRCKFSFSKWRVALSEYEYDFYPPFVTTATLLLSRPVMLKMYYASHVMKPYKLDDVFLGIAAKYLGVKPRHSENIVSLGRPFQKLARKYSRPEDFFEHPDFARELIAYDALKNPDLINRSFNALCRSLMNNSSYFLEACPRK